jgi:hypothetical protein
MEGFYIEVHRNKLSRERENGDGRQRRMEAGGYPTPKDLLTSHF